MASSISRRLFLATSASVLALAQSSRPVEEVFDHLLLGVSDLDHGMEWFEKRSGVRAVFGGVHPGRGTRNALVSLGGQHYLEIIATDPAQAGTEPQYRVAHLHEPRLIKFAVRTMNISATAALLKQAGVKTQGPGDGSRKTPSGELLRWRSLNIESDLAGNDIQPVPFFIEWAVDSVHPSTNAPKGCDLTEIRFEHPRSGELSGLFKSLGLVAKVSQASDVRIRATVKTPKGWLELS